MIFNTIHNQIYLKLLCSFAVLTIFYYAISSPANVIGQTYDELAQAVEICDNGFDDDADGTVDWQDEDCAPQAEEKQQQTAGSEEEEQTAGSEEEEQTAGSEEEEQTAGGEVEEQQTAGGEVEEQQTAGGEVEEQQIAKEICDIGVDNNGDGVIDGQDEDCDPQGYQEQEQQQENNEQSCTDNQIDCMTKGELTKKSENPQCPDNGNATDCITTGEIPSENPQCPDNGNATDCQAPNLAPIASAGNIQKVSTNETVSLSGLRSFDPDGNITSFHWAQTAGQPSVKLQDSNTIQPSFIAPIVSNESLLTFELTVKDDKGLTDTDSVDISVNASSSSDGTSEISDLRQTYTYDKMLDASLVDGETGKAFAVKLLSYTVNGTEMNVGKLDNEVDFSLNNSAKVRIVPENSSTQLEATDMTLVTDDGTDNYLNKIDDIQWELDSQRGVHSLIIDTKYSPGGGEAHYGAVVNVVAKEALSPIADAGENQVVPGNVTVILDGTKSSDPDGSISSYQWLQIDEGPLISVGGVDTPNPSFISPSNLGKDVNVTFRLTVTDNNGSNDTDDVSVLIKNTTLPKIEGTVILQPIPESLSVGQLYEFRGLLNLSVIPDGSYIQIRNGKGEQTDEMIAFGPIQSDGKFIAPWTAVPREETLRIYATYSDISGNIFRSEAFPLKVTNSKPFMAAQDVIYSSDPSLLHDNCGQKPCMEIWYNEWEKDPLNIYVITYDPNSRTSLDDSEGAVKKLSDDLKHKTGYRDKWNFYTNTYYGFPSPLETDEHPIDLLIELKDYAPGKCGISDVLQKKFYGYLHNEIYTNANCDVDYSTKHEVIHSLGIGHTYHEGNEKYNTNDMLCSVEWYGLGDRDKKTYTCLEDKDEYIDSKRPTEFNLRAIIDAYGTNGFEQPNNNNIKENYDPQSDYKYYCNPLPCESSASRYTEIGIEKIAGGNSNTHNDTEGSGNEIDFEPQKKTSEADKTGRFTDNDGSSDKNTFQSYRYNKLGVSLEHPPDWKFGSLKNGIQLIKEKNGVYLEIRKHNLESSNTNLKEYVFDDIKTRSTKRQGFEVFNITATVISGNLPAYATEYTFLKTENQKDFTLNGPSNKILRFWTFANGNAYTIAYVSERDDYDLYLPIALKIIDSLKINPQEKSVK